MTEQPPARSPRRRRVSTALFVAFPLATAAAIWSGIRGGWWDIGAACFGGFALLVLVAGIGAARDPRAVEAAMAHRSGPGSVNRGAEEAVRRTGGGGAGGMGSGVAAPPALYRESQPWDERGLPEPATTSRAVNRAQRRADARAVQRREAKISQREQLDRRRALDHQQRPPNGPRPKGR